MKRLIALFVLLPVIMLSACAANVTADGSETLVYDSMDGFINEVGKAKEAYEKTGDNTYHKIEEIDWYYDFKNPVKDVELDSAEVTSFYVTLSYRDKEAKAAVPLIIQIVRPSVNIGDEEQYLKHNKSWTDVVEITINGHKVIKREVYGDDTTTAEVENEHIYNEYIWVENGTGMYLRIPVWLLERYTEETFFDIEKVELE